MIQIICKEKDIEDILEKHMESMLGIKFLKRQHRTPVGIIDIIAKCPHEKNVYYIIEIKNSVLGSDAYVQVARYAKWLNSECSKNGKRVFIPILIGPSLAENLCHIVNLFNRYERCDKSNVKDVYYALFDFDPIKGISFEYHSITEREAKELYKFGHCHVQAMADDICGLEWRLHLYALSNGERE